MTCNSCGKDLENPKLGQKYCNKRCKRDVENISRRAKRARMDERDIMCHRYGCDNTFVPKSVNHKYCSEFCGEEARKEKNLLSTIAADIDPAILRARENDLVKEMRRKQGNLQRSVLRAESLKAAILSEVSDWLEGNLQPAQLDYDPFVWDQYTSDGLSGPVSDAHFLLSDPQGGKWNGEVGLKVLLEDYLPKLAHKILTCTAVQRSEGPVDHLFIHMLGDLVEGCTIYPGQRNELDRYKNGDSAVHQVLVMTKAIKELLIEPLRPHFKYMTVANAYGNHGRMGSKLDPSLRKDNLDLLVGNILKMVCEPYNINWVIPDDDRYLVRSQGWNIGGIHGHQFGQKASLNAMETNILRWEAIQHFGGPLDVLLMGHRHNPAAVQVQGIDVIQNGAIDGGSDWFTSTNGSWSAPSQEFFFVNEEYGMTGHRHLYVTPRVPRHKQYA